MAGIEDEPDGLTERARRDAPRGDTPDFEQDPSGDPDQPVETVVRYETAVERHERLREERSHRRHRRVTETGVALAALLISLAVFLVNGLLFLRGSDVEVLPPEQVTFYRDTGPTGSALKIGLDVRMINASSDYGDAVTSATLSIGPRRTSRGSFRDLAQIEAVMSRNVEKALADCAEGATCVGATGFYVVERPRKLLDLPGGAARSATVAFWIEAVNCEGEPDFCASITRFEDAVAHLRSRPDPILRMRLTFHSDGDEEVSCRLPADPARRKAIFDYLEEKGWAQVACERTPDRSRGATRRREGRR